MKQTFFIRLTFLIISNFFTLQNFAQQIIYVGIPSYAMNYFAASQHNTHWCWAASIQMVLNYYGVNITQEQIVARTYGIDPYGNLPNWGANLYVIHKNLNNWGLDAYGYPYVVYASFGLGAPSATLLIQELSQQRPIIIAYTTDSYTGHAVVVTAVSYIPTYYGPMIRTIVVRDPWPSQINIVNAGRVEYPASYLLNRIQGYWIIRVVK